MDKGYRVKVNGVYKDEMVGWCGWEEIGFTIMCTICLGGCGKQYKKADGYLTSGMCFVCTECYPKYVAKEYGPEMVSTGK